MHDLVSDEDVRQIVLQVGRTLGRGGDLVALSKYEQVVYLTWCYVGEVLNGGLAQFFFNSSGEYTRETIAALRFLGFREPAQSLADAALLLFGSHDVPADIDLRNEVMCATDSSVVDPTLNTMNEAHWRMVENGERVYRRLRQLDRNACDEFSMEAPI
jgi:hypothetical protein